MKCEIDKEIVGFINNLNKYVKTIYSCSGHNKMAPYVSILIDNINILKEVLLKYKPKIIKWSSANFFYEYYYLNNIQVEFDYTNKVVFRGKDKLYDIINSILSFNLSSFFEEISNSKVYIDLCKSVFRIFTSLDKFCEDVNDIILDYYSWISSGYLD